MPPVTRSHQSNDSSHTVDDPNLQYLLNAAAAEEEANNTENVVPESHRQPDVPESSRRRLQMPPEELPEMPKSWENAIQSAVKDFQKATEIFHRTQALVDKLVALQDDDKVIQSLMVKVPGLESSDPDSTPILRAGLEDITIRFRKECHAFYIEHERMIRDRMAQNLPQITKDFQAKVCELATPYGSVHYTSSVGKVSGKTVAIKWANFAAASFNRQTNQFQTELIERKASRAAALAARTEAREEAARQADDIPREEAISVLVQREVSKSARAQEQRLAAAIKPLQDQLSQLIKLQKNTVAPVTPAVTRATAPAQQPIQPAQPKNGPGRRRNKRRRQNPNQNTSFAGGQSGLNPNQHSRNTGLDPAAAPFVPQQSNAQQIRRRQPGPRPPQPPPPPPPRNTGKAHM